MSVYYRFKSNVNCDKVTFDGLHISVGELKRQILQQKKIGKSNDFDLQISNAETKEVYTSDDILIQKNTTVIVARVPVSSNKKQWKETEETLGINNNEAHISLDKIIKSSDVSNLDETEEEKLKIIMTQSTQDYDSSKFIKTRPMVGPVPPNYICYRCGKGGHYIKHCPTNQTDNVKRSTGIPRSFMMPAKADQKGALITSTGEYVVPIIDHQAYKEPKKEKPPFIPTENPEFDEKLAEKIPEELQCLLCKGLLHDAVMIPCCSNSYCDDCIRTCLLESEQHQCPTCLSTGISPDTLLPNRYLRNKVHKNKNELFFSSLNQVKYQNVNSTSDYSNNLKLNVDNKSPTKSPNVNSETKDVNILNKEILNKDNDENNKNVELTVINSSSKVETSMSTIEEDKQMEKEQIDNENIKKSSDVSDNKQTEQKSDDDILKVKSNEQANNESSDQINNDQINKSPNNEKSIGQSPSETNLCKNDKLKEVKEINNQQNEESNNKSIGSTGHKQNTIGNARQPNQRTMNQQMVQNPIINQQPTRHSILGNPPSNPQRIYSNNNNFNNNNSPQHQQQQMPFQNNNNYSNNNYQIQQRNSNRHQQNKQQNNNQMQQQQFNNIHHGAYANQMPNQQYNLRQFTGQQPHANYYGDPMMYGGFNGHQMYNSSNNYPIENPHQQYPIINSGYNHHNSYIDQNADLMYNRYLEDAELTPEEKLERFARELEERNKANHLPSNSHYSPDSLRKRSRSKSRQHAHRSRSPHRSTSYSRSRSRSRSSYTSSSSSRSTSKSYSRSRSRSIHQNNRRYVSSKSYHSRKSRSPRYNSKYRNYHDSSSNYHHLHANNKLHLSKSKSKSPLSYTHVNHARLNYESNNLDRRPYSDKYSSKHTRSIDKEYKDHYKSSKRSSDYQSKKSVRSSSLDKHSPNYEHHSSSKRSLRKEEINSKHNSGDRHKKKHSSHKHKSDKMLKVNEITNNGKLNEKQLETINESQEVVESLIKDKNKIKTSNSNHLEDSNHSLTSNSSHNSKNSSLCHNLVTKTHLKDKKSSIENNIEINKEQQKTNHSSKSSDSKSNTPEQNQESLFNLMSFHAERDSLEKDDVINKELPKDKQEINKETDDEDDKEEDEEESESSDSDEGLIEEDNSGQNKNQTKSIVVSPNKLVTEKESEKHRHKSEISKHRKDKSSSKKKHKSKDKKRDRDEREKSSRISKRKLETDENEYSLSSKKHKKKHKKEKKSKKHKSSKDRDSEKSKKK